MSVEVRIGDPRLPVHAQSMQTESTRPERPAIPSSPTEERRPVSLLLVDDHPTFLRVLRCFLETHGGPEIQVVGTASGATEGVAKAVVLHPQVVVMDLAMLDRHRLEVLPHLRRLRPEAGIITLSMLNPAGYRAAALAAGADEFVAKSTLEIDLLPAIRRVAHTARARRTPPGEPPAGPPGGPVLE